MKRSICAMLFFILSSLVYGQTSSQWTRDKARDWMDQQGWLVGCNFIPSTAINQLEMWQKDTFDPQTIDRELGLAEELGFNVVRVYLHSMVWKEDKKGFKSRIEEFLGIASNHNIKPLFVFFDDCWNDDPSPGPQPAPKTGVHNSGWMQCPGRPFHNDSTQWNELEAYVKDILRTFKNDGRILMWDLYNEPGNSGYGDTSMPLLKRIFSWAWEIRPSQPLTAAIWNEDLTKYNEYQLSNSDIITFHNYSDAVNLENRIKELQKIGRPFLCSEYMARTNKSKFETHLPIFKKYKVGAINWGLVSGKTNTIFPWGSKEGTPEPQVWFHDIFRKDGTPFDPNEVRIIKFLTKR